MFVRLTLSALALLSLAPGVLAQSPDYFGNDDFDASRDLRYTASSDSVRFDAAFGAMYLQGKEYVYIGDYKLSQLNWQSKVPMLRGSLAVNVGNGFSVRVEGSTAAFGSSYMEDYDWLGGSDADNAWTDRSQHNDTKLDHYFTGSLSAGYDLVNDGQSTLRVSGGVKYTDVKWSAYGGSYIYSNGGFRNQFGDFAAGAPGITYRQQLPELFVGVDGDVDYGGVRWGGMLRGGVTTYARTTDDHWMRHLQVIDQLGFAPTFTAGSDLGFALGPNVQLFIDARYSAIFRQRGQSDYYDTVTGNRTIHSSDAGAGELQTLELTGGLKGHF
ncbi:omptin family outer membrane protease [Devosia sp.]|uniref:omptin family outer membrane protease n=1 Tax=Devosia sp. TaxID=1871048 RepID=UPI003263BD62